MSRKDKGIMRDIKFRGKHIHAFIEPNNTGIWVYGYLCNDHYINSEELMGEMLVDKDTVGQYTGLHDKNGKEIYEGDIIEYKADGEIIYKGTVKYSEKYAQYVLVNTLTVKDEFEPLGEYNIEVFEVIGNIYDNPELLKEEG